MKKKSNSPAYKVGAICLIFLIIGYQIALFLNRAVLLRIAERQDQADTVFIIQYLPESSVNAIASTKTSTSNNSTAHHELSRSSATTQAYSSGRAGSRIDTVRRNSSHLPRIEAAREHTRTIETFAFDPNTATLEELQRLGFTQKQANSIINYRNKGGRFRRKSDFARSYVVADSVYKRLEPYIEIPLVDINLADSATFDALPGIGGYFAAQMVAFRERLGGYSHIQQLLDIYNFGQERFDNLADLICCSPPIEPLDLWTADIEQLRQHPYIGSYQVARGIVRFRENTPQEQLNVQNIIKAGIISSAQGEKLALCHIADPRE